MQRNRSNFCRLLAAVKNLKKSEARPEFPGLVRNHQNKNNHGFKTNFAHNYADKRAAKDVRQLAGILFVLEPLDSVNRTEAFINYALGEWADKYL